MLCKMGFILNIYEIQPVFDLVMRRKTCRIKIKATALRKTNRQFADFLKLREGMRLLQSVLSTEVGEQCTPTGRISRL
jgi:hypothetical protein